MQSVYIAWGNQGEDFTVHATFDGALAECKRNAASYGLDPDEVTGEAGDLDGFDVEERELKP